MIRVWMQEYKHLRRNQGGLLMLIGATVIYSFLYPLPYHAEVMREVPMAIVDEDATPLSRQLARMSDASEFLRVASRPASLEEAKEEFYQGKVVGIIVIPKDFQRRVRRGETATIAAYYDTSNLLYYRQLKTGITAVTRTLGGGIQVKRFQATGQPFKRALAAQDPMPVLGVPLFNPSGNYGAYAIPAVFCLLVQQTLLIGVGIVTGGIREETDPKTSARPDLLKTLQLVFGKCGAYFTVALPVSIYSLTMVHLYYGYPLRTSPLPLVIFILPYFLSSIFLSLTVAPFFRSREMAVLTVMCTSMPFVFLSGFAWPPEAFPHWLLMAARAVPSTLGVDGFLRLSQMATPLRDVFFNYQMLWILTGVYFVTACLATRLLVRVPQSSSLTIQTTGGGS